MELIKYWMNKRSFDIDFSNEKHVVVACSLRNEGTRGNGNWKEIAFVSNGLAVWTDENVARRFCYCVPNGHRETNLKLECLFWQPFLHKKKIGLDLEQNKKYLTHFFYEIIIDLIKLHLFIHSLKRISFL